MSKPFPAIPTKLHLPPSALPVTSLIRFSVASQQPSPSSVGILFDPLSSHNRTCKFREFLKCFPRDSNGWFPVSHTKKLRRCSLVQFISCPRVARSYFLCDSISAAGTLTQDSLLLLPSHNTVCNFRVTPSDN